MVFRLGVQMGENENGGNAADIDDPNRRVPFLTNRRDKKSLVPASSGTAPKETVP